MSCSLIVLKDIKYDLETRLSRSEIEKLRNPDFADACSEFLEQIYNDTCQNIISAGDPDGPLRMCVDYFKDNYMSYKELNETSYLGFGALKPDSIKEEILTWNQKQTNALIESVKAFEETAQRANFDKISDLLKAKTDDTGIIPDGTFRYPASPYTLYKQIAAAQDIFSYGHSQAYFDEYCEFSPLVPRDVMERARISPSDFLILELYYE